LSTPDRVAARGREVFETMTFRLLQRETDDPLHAIAAVQLSLMANVT
jgi:hypothetical protein